MNPVDPIDLELLDAVDEGVPWRGLLRSASCPPEEAEGRLYRMLLTGVLEGTPGDAAAPVATSVSSVASVPAPSPAAAPAGAPAARATVDRTTRETVPDRVTERPRRDTTPDRPSVMTGPQSSVPPNPYGAGESLLRELARRSGVSFAPVDPARGRASSVPPVHASEPPRASSVPAAPSQSTPSGYGHAPLAPRAADSSRPSSPGFTQGVSTRSPLLPLIDEFAHGQGMQRWAAARLREALVEELAGNFTQAVAILQIVMAQIEDPRIRGERDRLQASVKQASSGVHRSRAVDAERNRRFKEALEHWAKVLEAFPQDADAALHAALSAMESGNLKMGGVFAKRAVELAPDNVNAHRLLHRFFRKTGMELSAKREAEIIQKLKKA